MKFPKSLKYTLIALLFVLIYPAQAKLTHDSRTGHGMEGLTIHCGIPQEMGLAGNLEYGFHYRYLKVFASAHHCEIDACPIKDTVNFCDSLRKGIYDLVVIPELDSIDLEGITLHYTPDSSILWATTAREASHALVYDEWLGYVSGESPALAKFFNGLKKNSISPYDDLIKKNARTLGWDWKMLAALIMKESRFNANAVSPRGAIGLMQVMPSSVEKYSLGNLFDPEENLRAGTLYLKRIQDRLRDEGMTEIEMFKLTLACYNAGFYRINDARNLSRNTGLNQNHWDSVQAAFELMPEFDGSETRAFVSKVLDIYSGYSSKE